MVVVPFTTVLVLLLVVITLEDVSLVIVVVVFVVVLATYVSLPGDFLDYGPGFYFCPLDCRFAVGSGWLALAYCCCYIGTVTGSS